MVILRDPGTHATTDKFIVFVRSLDSHQNRSSAKKGTFLPGLKSSLYKQDPSASFVIWEYNNPENYIQQASPTRLRNNYFVESAHGLLQDNVCSPVSRCMPSEECYGGWKAIDQPLLIPACMHQESNYHLNL